MSTKSMTTMPPMSRRRSWRTISSAASRLLRVTVSSSVPPAPVKRPVLTSMTVIASVRSMTRVPPLGSQTLRSKPLASCSSTRWAAKTSSGPTQCSRRSDRSGLTSSMYCETVDQVLSPETMSLRKSSLKTSRMTLTASSGSPLSRTGALPLPFMTEDAFLSMASHWATRRSTSAVSCSWVAPSAAVRTMTPAESGTIRLRIFFRRLRSVSGSLREMPVMVPPGTRTRYRPARVIWLVRRAPLWPMGSFVTWTRTVSPLERASSMRRGLPSRPAASQLTSPA